MKKTTSHLPMTRSSCAKARNCETNHAPKRTGRKLTQQGLATFFFSLSLSVLENSELAHIPDDLRGCLETALGEDPSPASLDQYLPRIKEVIINLLQGLRQKQNVYREQYEARTARMQGTSSPSTTRIRTSISGGRHPSLSKPAEPVAAAESYTTMDHAKGVMQANGAGSSFPAKMTPAFPATPPPTLSVSTPRDEPLHAETLASLRKSDAITRRASSRRHSQRFSTLLEQNAPPVPRRHPVSDSNLLMTYPGYNSSQPPTPAMSPSALPVYSQFPPHSPYDNFPVSPALSTGSGSGYMDAMPLPPTLPVPPLPSGVDKGPAAPVVPPATGATTPTIPTDSAIAEPVANTANDTEQEPAVTAVTEGGANDTTEVSFHVPLEPAGKYRWKKCVVTRIMNMTILI